MRLKRAARLFFMLHLALSAFPAAAQNDGGSEEMPIDADWSGPAPDLYSRGDKIFSLTAGIIIPTLFLNEKTDAYTSNLSVVGGTGSLGFSYFMDAHLFVGGEIGGSFSQSLMKNFLFIIPIGAKAGYQFVLGKFEIPISLLLGIAPTRYLDKEYLGLFMKPQVSLFYRFNPDWSFGLNAAWHWVPQWPKEAKESRYGNFLELSLSARYHF